MSVRLLSFIQKQIEAQLIALEEIDIIETPPSAVGGLFTPGFYPFVDPSWLVAVDKLAKVASLD